MLIPKGVLASAGAGEEKKIILNNSYLSAEIAGGNEGDWRKDEYFFIREGRLMPLKLQKCSGWLEYGCRVASAAGAGDASAEIAQKLQLMVKEYYVGEISLNIIPKS